MKSKQIQAILDDENFKEKISDLPDELLNNIVDGKHTQLELQAAFELIQDKNHWKNPIKSIIKSEDFEICDSACIHFTGGNLEIVNNLSNDELEVSSEGYYVNIGA